MSARRTRPDALARAMSAGSDGSKLALQLRSMSAAGPCVVRRVAEASSSQRERLTAQPSMVSSMSRIDRALDEASSRASVRSAT
eukprot:scaffold69309_cov65-Phaeocystis_antarctica.AAC.11